VIDRPLERVLTLGFDRGCSKAQFLKCIVQCLPTDTAPNVSLGSASPGELSSTLIWHRESRVRCRVDVGTSALPGYAGDRLVEIRS
jgi:hypothetical protein